VTGNFKIRPFSWFSCVSTASSPFNRVAEARVFQRAEMAKGAIFRVE